MKVNDKQIYYFFIIELIENILLIINQQNKKSKCILFLNIFEFK